MMKFLIVFLIFGILFGEQNRTLGLENYLGGDTGEIGEIELAKIRIENLKILKAELEERTARLKEQALRDDKIYASKDDPMVQVLLSQISALVNEIQELVKENESKNPQKIIQGQYLVSSAQNEFESAKRAIIGNNEQINKKLKETKNLLNDTTPNINNIDDLKISDIIDDIPEALKPTNDKIVNKLETAALPVVKPTYAKINAQRVNFRKNANTNAKIIKMLAKNQKVRLIDYNDTWANIELNNIKGFVARKFITPISDVKILASLEEISKQQQAKEPLENTNNQYNTPLITPTPTLAINNTDKQDKAIQQEKENKPQAKKIDKKELVKIDKPEAIKETTKITKPEATKETIKIAKSEVKKETKKITKPEVTKEIKKTDKKENSQNSKTQQPKQNKEAYIMYQVKAFSTYAKVSPDANSANITLARQNTKLRVINIENGWAKVLLRDGFGFIEEKDIVKIAK